MEKNEINTILKFVENSIAKGHKHLSHLDSRLAIRRYIRKADEILSYQKEGRILDWGCGYGQMTFLLINRGFDVVSFDIKSNIEPELPLLDSIDQKVYFSEDRVNIPFESKSFDAILSSGVLEHVEDINTSLREIRRILKPKGYFYIYAFPNKYSYIEYIGDKMGISCHPIRYTLKEIKKILIVFGFILLKVSYENFLPKNFSVFPSKIRQLRDKIEYLYAPLDRLLVKIPLINMFSTDIKAIAVKSADTEITNEDCFSS